MSEKAKMSKNLLIGLGVLLAGAVVAANQYGVIVLDGNVLTGAVGALVVAARVILGRVQGAGFGWKAISAGVALFLLAVAQSFGLAVPPVVITVIEGFAAYALGHANEK